MLKAIQNPILKAVFWAFFITQCLKFLIYWLRNRKINFRLLLGYGGMPSSHSATIVALATAVGRCEGWTSSIFAVTLICAIIIISDAVGFRRAAGHQATILNMIFNDLYHNGRINERRLKELLGHTPIEVIIGGILGYLVALWLT